MSAVSDQILLVLALPSSLPLDGFSGGSTFYDWERSIPRAPPFISEWIYY